MKIEIAIGIIILIVICIGGIISMDGGEELRNFLDPQSAVSVQEQTKLPADHQLRGDSLSVAVWRTYRSEKLGYSLRYPSDWYVAADEERRISDFQSPETQKWSDDNKKNCGKGEECFDYPSYDLQITTISSEEFKKEIGRDSINEETVMIGGKEFIKYEIFGSMVSGDTYRIERGGMIYVFEILGERSVPVKIIESFQFI